MEKSRKRSRNHFEKRDFPIKERKRCVVWEDHRSSLDELFFRDCDLIKRFVQTKKYKINIYYFFHLSLISLVTKAPNFIQGKSRLQGLLALS